MVGSRDRGSRVGVEGGRVGVVESRGKGAGIKE